MATYTTQNPGNLAIQQEVWTLSIPEAKAAMKLLDCHQGTYWGRTLATPCRRAVRAKADYVRVYTGGFLTGELANVLAINTEVKHANN